MNGNRRRPKDMADDIRGKRIAFLMADEGVEQIEFTQPWDAVKEAGGDPELLTPKDGEAQAFNHLDKGDTFPVDRTTVDAKAEDFDGVVLPGGVANPDQLRTDGPAVSFCGRSSRRASRSRRSAMGRGRCRGVAYVGARLLRGRASRPTSATRAASGSTRRSAWTAAWAQVATLTTSKRSARRRSRSLPRAPMTASATRQSVPKVARNRG